ncbi:AAA family ATPase [Eubacterium aggregans]|uniref:AAA family ATPase n=1 Tax=Eubacterium aggregans TaxID=81409 RepID=UPI003F2EAF21
MKELNQRQRDIMERYGGLVAKEGSNKSACKKIDVSDASMSAIRNGDYKGDVDAVLAKVADYRSLKEEAQVAFVGIGYRDTSISHQVYGYIRNAQIKGGLIALSGDAGIGKTQAIKEYCKDHPHYAIWMTASPCLNDVKPVLKALCRTLGVSDRTNYDMFMGIIDKLSDGMVIIIDEAQHLSIKTIEALRAFSDYFSDRGMTLGIIFVGNLETINKFGGKEVATFHQIANRTKQRPILKAVDICQDDIEMLFPDITDADSQKFLLAIAQSKQAVRGCMNLYSNAVDNDDTSYSGLVAMAKYMEMRI